MLFVTAYEVDINAPLKERVTHMTAIVTKTRGISDARVLYNTEKYDGDRGRPISLSFAAGTRKLGDFASKLCTALDNDLWIVRNNSLLERKVRESDTRATFFLFSKNANDGDKLKLNVEEYGEAKALLHDVEIVLDESASVATKATEKRRRYRRNKAKKTNAKEEV